MNMIKEGREMRIPFGRFLSMFADGDPRGELYLLYSVISLAALAAVTGLIIIIHIRRRRKSDEMVREIMENCRDEQSGSDHSER